MRKLIALYDGKKRKIELIVIGNNRNDALIELMSTGKDIYVTQCSVSMGEFNIQGTLKNATLIDIEKLERDGWKWLGMKGEN